MVLNLSQAEPPGSGSLNCLVKSLLVGLLKPSLQIIGEERPKFRVCLDEPCNITKILDPFALPLFWVGPRLHLAFQSILQRRDA